MIEMGRGVGCSTHNNTDSSRIRKCKLKSRLNTSLGEKAKLAEDKCAQRNK